MTSRERLLAALSNKRPDRLPGQVHGWTQYYLDTYLGGADQFTAYERFGLDMVIYTGPEYLHDEQALANWQVQHTDLGTNSEGVSSWIEVVTTPEGELKQAGASNEITPWLTEHLVKDERDMELFLKYYPVPTGINSEYLKSVRDKLGDRGITRGCLWCYGQMGAWQSFCYMVGTQEAIMFAMDNPDWVHYVEQSLVDKQLGVIEMMGDDVPLDLIELGGGSGSNTVISPKMHQEFCVPYDKQQVDALHSKGYRTAYHLCGGVMKMLDNVVANGSDGLETMTPTAMGGDCDLAEATRLVGDKLFFVGGFDQNNGFERGNPERVRRMVHDLHSACPDGGYICSPSDHFFFGDPANIQAFADALKECIY